MRDLTDKEMETLNYLRDAMNSFSELPSAHPADIEEFVGGLHVLQNIVLARPATESIYVKEEDNDDETPVQIL